MNEESLNQLINGYREFRKDYVGANYAAYRSWAAKMQIPKIMMIACSDSRINPAIVTHAGLGEVFMVNNVANLVPPYKEGKDTHHSTSAALEFAVNHLKVEHIIVMGHSKCGGIRALMEGIASTDSGVYSFIAPWMNIARKAKESTLRKYSNYSPEEQCSHCERESLLVSLENLRTFPWVKNALSANVLALHAWHFNVESGTIEYYSRNDERFLPLLEDGK
ncbi:MAG: carbonic anhydrase [Rickettsiales bacterium]|nr:carbonic anhydrase [Rickettsiales bacterium]